MNRVLAFVAAVGLCLASAVSSAQALDDPRRVLNGFQLADMQNVGAEIGYQTEVVRGNDDSIFLKYTTGEGNVFFVAPAVCDQTTCYGLDIYTFFGSDAGVPLSALNFFNYYRAFTKTFSQNGTIILSRYIIADFGIPKGNIASNLTNFVGVAKDFDTFLRQGAGGNAYSVTSLEDSITSYGLAPDASEPQSTDVMADRIIKRGIIEHFNGQE